MKHTKIVLPGGAGLVGQNLLVQLNNNGYQNVTVIDKHHDNIEILKNTFPDVVVIEADLAEKGAWASAFVDADVVVMLQAQIGAKQEQPFIRNNVTSTNNIIDAMRANESPPYLVHVSSSVLESVANDYYTNTKKQQEDIVLASQLDGVVLRPTLMFGWFDRKHLGWLSRFMSSVPLFPIPGHGRYMRQPLYVKDFCAIIIGCIETKTGEKVYNISGQEKVDYIDIIREIKKAIKSNTPICRIPYSVFYLLLKIWAIFDSDPPFTTSQLAALIAPDEFETIDWPDIFNVQSTPFATAIDETFNHQTYSKIKLDF